MSEFRLASPITVFGPADRSGGGGRRQRHGRPRPGRPTPAGQTAGIETGYDQDGKFMAGRELVSRDVTDPKTGEAQIESIILSVSTVVSTRARPWPAAPTAWTCPGPAAQPGHRPVTDRPSHPAGLGGQRPACRGFPEMSEDDSSSSPAEHSEKKRGWRTPDLRLLGEPHTRDELVAVLHTAQEEGLIAADTLKMMEGAISVAELTVGDVDDLALADGLAAG